MPGVPTEADFTNAACTALPWPGADIHWSCFDPPYGVNRGSIVDAQESPCVA